MSLTTPNITERKGSAFCWTSATGLLVKTGAGLQFEADGRGSVAVVLPPGTAVAMQLYTLEDGVYPGTTIGGKRSAAGIEVSSCAVGPMDANLSAAIRPQRAGNVEGRVGLGPLDLSADKPPGADAALVDAVVSDTVQARQWSADIEEFLRGPGGAARAKATARKIVESMSIHPSHAATSSKVVVGELARGLLDQHAALGTGQVTPEMASSAASVSAVSVLQTAEGKAVSEQFGERMTAFLAGKLEPGEVKALGQELTAAYVDEMKTSLASANSDPAVAEACQSGDVSKVAAALRQVGKAGVGIGAAGLALYGFMVGLKGMGDAMKMANRETVDLFFGAQADPMAGFCVALLATFAMQTSSGTTSLIVNMVAAAAVGATGVPFEVALPMIIGANLGTASTSTMMAFLKLRDREKFEKAFSAGVQHDWMNLLMATAVLGVPYAAGKLIATSGRAATEVSSTLEPVAAQMAAFGEWLTTAPMNALGDVARTASAALQSTGFEGVDSPSLSAAIKAPVKLLQEVAPNVAAGNEVLLQAVVFGGLTALSLALLTKVLSTAAGDHIQTALAKVKNTWTSVGLGAGLTALVGSSSAVTTTNVPLVAEGKMSQEQALAISAGSNVGTTLTALLVAAGLGSAAAMDVALFHTVLNVGLVVAFMSTAAGRRLPINLAKKCGRGAARFPLAGAVGVAGLFVVAPGLVVYDVYQDAQQAASARAPVVAQAEAPDDVKRLSAGEVVNIGGVFMRLADSSPTQREPDPIEEEPVAILDRPGRGTRRKEHLTPPDRHPTDSRDEFGKVARVRAKQYELRRAHHGRRSQKS